MFIYFLSRLLNRHVQSTPKVPQYIWGGRRMDRGNVCMCVEEDKINVKFSCRLPEEFATQGVF